MKHAKNNRTLKRADRGRRRVPSGKFISFTHYLIHYYAQEKVITSTTLPNTLLNWIRILKKTKLVFLSIKEWES